MRHYYLNSNILYFFQSYNKPITWTVCFYTDDHSQPKIIRTLQIFSYSTPSKVELQFTLVEKKSRTELPEKQENFSELCHAHWNPHQNFEQLKSAILDLLVNPSAFPSVFSVPLSRMCEHDRFLFILKAPLLFFSPAAFFSSKDFSSCPDLLFS